MSHTAVIGAQWGDEGKGKVVDLLSDRFDVVARFQGGPNAGHTVKFDGQTYALHHVPSGVFRPAAFAVIGNGTVLDPAKLLEELDMLTERGIELGGRLFISDRAHVILPVMKQLDALSERTKPAADKIGTTLRGIGPTYEAKAARWGVRLGDLADRADLESRLARILSGPCGDRLREAGEAVGDAAEQAAELHGYWQRLSGYVTDTAMQLNDWIDEGKSVLFEGAQGTMLDVDHGTYPYVTSSNTMAGGLCAGLGVAPTLLSGVLGVYKAYSTRVGAGPLPTELFDADGELLRERGQEFGTTTGRPRRCGWLDGVAGRHANRINRFRGICVTLLDVLDHFDELSVCVGYEVDGRHSERFPASIAEAERATPIYEQIAGWGSDTTGCRSWDELPERARAYIDRVGEIIGVPVVMVGVGANRDQSIVRPGTWLAEQLERATS